MRKIVKQKVEERKLHARLSCNSTLVISRLHCCSLSVAAFGDDECNFSSLAGCSILNPKQALPNTLIEELVQECGISGANDT